MRTVAVIPALNEGGFVYQVVSDCLRHVDDVIVSDDGSTDDTADKALSAGAMVLRKPPCISRGMGSATMRAIRHIIGNCDVIVTLDGDGQHDPKDITKLLIPIIVGTADLVTGSRFSRANRHDSMPLYRRLGNNIITGAFNIGTKPRHKITDSQCCFRAYHKNVFETIGTDFVEAGFPFSIEVLIKARHAGFRVSEVPIDCIYHSNLRDNSTMNPIRHGVSTLVSTTKWRLWELSRGRRQ